MFLTALLGWPVGHSRSPAMHNAAFAAAGIAGIYLALPVRPEHLGAGVAGLRALGFRGANVTIPHKQAVLPYLDELSPAAQATCAVNTILVQEDGTLAGDNTDAPGFLADLAGHGINLEELRRGGALILGAGGSARAVAFALASASVPVYILARRPEQAEQLIAALNRAQALRPYLRPLTTDLRPLTSDLKLLINCTPAGMLSHTSVSPWPEDLPIHPEQIVYDLVYNPQETLFMRQARAVGAGAISGLGMLLHQGALSWQLWTGQPAPLAAMRQALENPMTPSPGS